MIGHVDYKSQRIIDLEGKLKRNKNGPMMAIFDFGTKALRVFVGPKSVPEPGEDWFSKRYFHNDRINAELGLSFLDSDGSLDVNNSHSLNKAIEFINSYVYSLCASGKVDKNDITIVGTAVFRWIHNRKEVLDFIKSKTGVQLIILDKESEAFLSQMSIGYTHPIQNIRLVGQGFDNTPPGKEAKDYILLIDQGGGSTEISLGTPQGVAKQESINDLGTIKLLHDFFYSNTNPLENTNSIKSQYRIIEKSICAKIDEWAGFNDLINKDIKVNKFG